MGACARHEGKMWLTVEMRRVVVATPTHRLASSATLCWVH